MKLYLVTRRDDALIHDAYGGHVIAADTAMQARKLAASTPGDEGEAVWISPKKSLITCIADNCKYLEPGIVLSDFNAG